MHAMMRMSQALSLVVVVVAVGAGAAGAQQQPRVKAAFFAMTVPSMDATIAWYKDKLGLEVRRRGTPGGGTIEQAHLATAWLEVELFMSKDARPEAKSSASCGVDKIGVFVGEQTYSAILARLREHKAEFIGREMTESDGSRFFMVQDNNGLAIQIFMVPS